MEVILFLIVLTATILVLCLVSYLAERFIEEE